MPVIPTQDAISAALKRGRLPDRFDDALPSFGASSGLAAVEEAYVEYANGDNAEESPLVDTNPKTRNGATKPSLGLIPPVAMLHEATAMEDGADKYGPFNWRTDPVSAMTYVHALKRHCDNWLDGQEFTSDTGVHNLGAVRACAGILLDAQACGTLIDDRPPPGMSAETQEALRLVKIEKLKAALEALEAAAPEC